MPIALNHLKHAEGEEGVAAYLPQYISPFEGQSA